MSDPERLLAGLDPEADFSKAVHHLSEALGLWPSPSGRVIALPALHNADPAMLVRDLYRHHVDDWEAAGRAADIGSLIELVPENLPFDPNLLKNYLSWARHGWLFLGRGCDAWMDALGEAEWAERIAATCTTVLVAQQVQGAAHRVPESMLDRWIREDGYHEVAWDPSLAEARRFLAARNDQALVYVSAPPGRGARSLLRWALRDQQALPYQDVDARRVGTAPNRRAILCPIEFSSSEQRALIQHLLGERPAADPMAQSDDALGRPKDPAFAPILGESAALKKCLHQLMQASQRPRPVYLLGETGTGKELFARALHRLSGREPYVSVNVSTVSGQDQKGEFHGWKKGAFTGAVKDHPGFLGAANGGVLFMDEVASLEKGVQETLLRAFGVDGQGERQPLGTSKPEKIDLFVISASNRSLQLMSQLREFGEDLYHRLTATVVRLPPLRERGSDALLLAKHFLARERQLLKKSEVLTWDTAAEAAILAYRWPGNVRELEEAMGRLADLLPGSAESVDVAALEGAMVFKECDRLCCVGEAAPEAAVELLRLTDERRPFFQDSSVSLGRLPVDDDKAMRRLILSLLRGRPINPAAIDWLAKNPPGGELAGLARRVGALPREASLLTLSHLRPEENALWVLADGDDRPPRRFASGVVVVTPSSLTEALVDSPRAMVEAQRLTGAPIREVMRVAAPRGVFLILQREGDDVVAHVPSSASIGVRVGGAGTKDGVSLEALPPGGIARLAGGLCFAMSSDAAGPIFRATTGSKAADVRTPALPQVPVAPPEPAPPEHPEVARLSKRPDSEEWEVLRRLWVAWCLGRHPDPTSPAGDFEGFAQAFLAWDAAREPCLRLLERLNRQRQAKQWMMREFHRGNNWEHLDWILAEVNGAAERGGGSRAREIDALLTQRSACVHGER